MSNWWEAYPVVSADALPQSDQTVAVADKPKQTDRQQQENWWEAYPAMRADVGPKALLSGIEDDKKQQEEQARLHEAHQSIERYGEAAAVASQVVTDTASLAERLIGMGDRADEVNRNSAMLDQAMTERDATYWRSNEDPEGMSTLERAGQYMPFLKQGLRGAVRSLGSALLGAKGAGALTGAGKVAAGAATGAARGAAARGAAGVAAGAAQGAARGAAARGAAGVAAGAAQGAGAAARGVLATGATEAGAYGAIGLASSQEANKAITEGADAGLEGSALAGYVASQGTIEAFPAMLMQKLGLGGVEALVAGPAIRGGIKAGFIAAIKATGQEIPEELETELLSAVSSEWAGVDKEALDPDRLSSLVADTVLQTVLMGAGAGAVQAVQGAMHKNQDSPPADEVATDSMVSPSSGASGLAVQAVAQSLMQSRLQRLQEIRSKGFVSAEDAAKEGIEGKNRKERLANADKQIEELTQQIPPESPNLPTVGKMPPPLPGQPPAEPQVPPPSPGPPRLPGPTGAAAAPPVQPPRLPGPGTGSTGPGLPPPSTPPVDPATPPAATQPGATLEQAATESPSAKPEVQPSQKPAWDVIQGQDGKLYRENPQAKSNMERIGTRQLIDPSEGIALVTKDQWGKPIPAETLKARQEFADKAKPGAEFESKGYKGQSFKVLDDGTLLNSSGRKMGDVQTMANTVAPGDVTWTVDPERDQAEDELAGLLGEETPSTAGPSGGSGTKPTTVPPTVSPDAPAKPETSMGETTGENQPSEARAAEPKFKFGQVIPAEEADRVVSELRAGDDRSKNKGQGRVSEGIKEPLVVSTVPLKELDSPDPDYGTYLKFLEATTDPKRVESYVKQKIDTPAFITQARDTGQLIAADGGHRIIAAMKRGDTEVPALVPVAVHERLHPADAANSKGTAAPPTTATPAATLKLGDHVQVEGTDITGSVGAIQASRGVLVHNFNEKGSAWHPIEKVRATERKPDFVDELVDKLGGKKSTPDPDIDRAIGNFKKSWGIEATPVAKLSDEQQEALDFATSRGQKLAFVDIAKSDKKAPIGSFQRDDKVVLISNALQGDKLWGMIGHEMAHSKGLDEILPADSAELKQMMDEYYQTASPDVQKRLKTSRRDHMREGRARMVQKFFEDKAFRDQLKQDNPTLWDKLREAVLKFIGKWTPKDEAKRMLLDELRAAPKPQKRTNKKPAQENLSEDKNSSAQPDKSIDPSVDDVIAGVSSAVTEAAGHAINVVDSDAFDRELSKTVGSRMRSMSAAVQGRKSGEAKQIRDFDFEDLQPEAEAKPDRVQQIQDAFPLSREEAITADILVDSMSLPGEMDIAPPGTAIPGDSLTQISKAAELMAKEGKKYATEEEFFAAWDKALKAVKGKRLGMSSTTRAVNDAAEDIDAWMKANPEFQDYYSKDNAKERAAVARLYPELRNDADWAFYKIVGAIASNSTTLSENITEQIDAWGNFRSKRKTIKDPSGIAEDSERRFDVEIGRNERGHPTLGKTGFPLHGGAQAVKAQHYLMLNEVINQQGNIEKAVQWLVETVPAASIRYLPKAIGAGPMNGKQVRQIKDTVQAATGQSEQIPRMFVFGPKLGAYAMNHLGRSEYTTIDVWESRFWRSFFKDAPENTELETDSAAREAFKKAGNEFAKKLGLSSSEAQAVRWYYMIHQVNEAGYQKARSNETISAYTERAVAKRLDSTDTAPPSKGQAAKSRAGQRSSALRSLLGDTIFGEEVASQLNNVNWERLEELGTTTNPKEAGYIKPEGTFADFSGKRIGGSPGERAMDHREAGGTAGMQELIAYGWIRMDENSGSIDIAKLPTPQQLSAITRMAERHDGEIVVDLEDGLGEWSEGNEYYRTPARRWSQEYPAGTKPRRIVNDIKKFFGGDTPNTLLQKQRDQQGTIQAWTHFVNASKAIIGATDKADVSSFFHELGHPMRRFLFNRDVPQDERGNITDNDIDYMEEFLGVEDGNWTIDNEERFVDALMKYWREGKHPNKQVESIFQKISAWLSKVLSVLERDIDLDDRVRTIFDKVHQRGKISPEKLKALAEASSEKSKAAQASEPAVAEDVKEEFEDLFADVFGDVSDDLAKVESAGIKIKKTKSGWSVTGLPDNLSQEIKDGIKAEGGRQTRSGYFFKKNPTTLLVPTAEAISDANRQAEQAAAAGMVSTPIGILSQEDAEWYTNERQRRLDIAKQMRNEQQESIDELLGNFVPSAKRGLFKIALLRAAEKGDSDTMRRFDEMVEYSINHPELGLPQTENGLFELLQQPVVDEKELAQQIDDEFAREFAAQEGDTSFDFGLPTEPAPTQQMAIEGLEEDVARLERKELYEAKQAKLKAKLDSESTRGKQKTFLTDIYGDPSQGTLFDPDGVPDDNDTLFQSQVDPKRQAAQLAKDALEGGATTFEDYVDYAVQAIGKEQIKALAPSMEWFWANLRTRKGYEYLSEAGKVSDRIPDESKPKKKSKAPPPPGRTGPRVAGVRTAQAPFPDRQVEREPYTDHELTGIARAVMDDLRELAGIPELEAAPPETIEQWALDAQSTIAADPHAPTRLLNEIIANPARALDHHDAMLLAFRYRELANQAEPHFQEMVDASKSGDAERIAKARTNYILARQPMTDFEELTLKAKSTWGRTGVALQVMLRKDNTVAGLLRRAREANHGKPLTPEQEIEMRDLADRFAKLQQKLDEETARADKAEAEVASLRHLKKVVGESPTRKKPSKQQKTALDTAWGEIAKLANVDLLFQRDATNPFHNTVQVYRDLGVETFAELRRHVQERLGKEQADKLEEQFKQAWEATKPEVEVDPIIDRGDLGQLTREARRIERSIVEGLLVDHSTDAVLEMRDQIVDAVHAEMQELLEDESFTRRQTMDALSGYGQFSRPSQDTTDTLLRNLNAEVLKLRQIDQLGDAVARTEKLRAEGKTDEEISDILIKEGLLVKPTGLVRDTPSDTLRALSRRYSELKKDIPASSEGRAGLLQTAIAAIERGLANRIRDLNHAIANQEPIKIGRKAPPTNEKIEKLKEERDALLKDYRKLFPPEKRTLTPEQRLANAIKAAERSIAVLEKQIATRNFDKETREALPDSPELQSLKDRLERLKDQRNAAKALELSAWEGEGGALQPGRVALSEAQKQQRRARKAIEKIRQQLQDLKDGKETTKGKRPDLLEPELRQQLKDWKDKLKAAKQAAKDTELSAWEGEGGAVAPDPKEAAYRKAYIASLQNRIAKLQQYLLEGDFAPKQKKAPRVLSKQELELKKQLAELNTEKLKKMADYHLSHLKGVPWVADKISEVLHLARAIETSMDLSALGRQGGLIALGHPSLAKNALVGVMKSLVQSFDKNVAFNRQDFKWSELEQFLTGIDSREAELAFMHQLTDGEWGEYRQLAGLDLPSTDQAITRQEEVFQGRWGKLVPGVSISSRLYTMILNKMRADMFDLMVEKLGRQGKPSIEEAKMIANFVNVMTGRSDLGRFNKAAATLNGWFFAPRYVASRFQYLAMPFYLPFKGGLKANWQVKNAILKEYVRTFSGAALVLGLVALAGQLFWDDDDEDKPTVDSDPTSSDFLKVKIGETRYDFLAGLQQIIVLSARMAPEELGGGRIGDNKFSENTGAPFEQNRLTVATKFARTKLAPGPGYVVTALNGWKNVVGDKADSVFGFKVHPAIGTTAQLFVPLSTESMEDAFETQSLPVAVGSSILSILGVGMSTYGPKTKYMTGTPEERNEQIADDLKAIKWDSPRPAYAEFLTQDQLTKFETLKSDKFGDLIADSTGSPESAAGVESQEKAIAKLKASGVPYAKAVKALDDWWKSPLRSAEVKQKYLSGEIASLDRYKREAREMRGKDGKLVAPLRERRDRLRKIYGTK